MFLAGLLAAVALVPLMVSASGEQHQGNFICFKIKESYSRKLHITQLKILLWLKASSTERYKIT